MTSLIFWGRHHFWQYLPNISIKVYNRKSKSTKITTWQTRIAYSKGKFPRFFTIGNMAIMLIITDSAQIMRIMKKYQLDKTR